MQGPRRYLGDMPAWASSYGDGKRNRPAEAWKPVASWRVGRSEGFGLTFYHLY